MQYTGNYNLKKPDGNNNVNIDDFNDNADIIDQQLKDNADEIATKETPQGAQQKADQAQSNANSYTDQQVSNITVPVTSVNNKTGDVTVTKDDVGLGDVDNVQQASKQEFDEHKAEEASQDNVHGLRGTKIVLGENSIADGDDSVVVGRDSIAAHPRSVVIGTDINSRGADIVGIGTEASLSSGQYAVAIGARATTAGRGTVAIGYMATSENANEGVLGHNGASSTTRWFVRGAFTVDGTKNFEMPHPHPNKKATHRIRHGAVESPTAGDTLYRYTIEATEDGETVEMQLPDYFQYLNKNVDVWVNGDGHFGRAFGTVEGDTLKVTCELAGFYKCLVIGTRNDDHDSVQDWDIKGVEREIGESWTGETYVFSDDEIIVEDEYIEEEVA